MSLSFSDLRDKSVWKMAAFKMKHLVLLLSAVLLFVGEVLPDDDKKSSAYTITSNQLLQYDDISHRVLLNQALLDELEALQGPLHVVTVIGDARIGKSTALNVMTALLTTKDKKGRVHSVPNTFSVCQSQETCTKGVWVNMIPLSQGGHIIMLDVEGTDLGGDLVTTRFSLLTAYLSSNLLIFLKESVPKRAAIFLHELARLKERLKLHNTATDNDQMLYVTIRDPLKPPEDMSLKGYVSKTLTNPSYCIDIPEECKLLEKHFPLTKVNVYSLPYVSRRHQKSLEWTLKDKDYFRTVSSLTHDLKSTIDSKRDTSTPGQVFSGIIRTFMRTLKHRTVSSPASSFNDVCIPGDKSCLDTSQNTAESQNSVTTDGDTLSVTINTKRSDISTKSDSLSLPGASEQATVAARGPDSLGALDIEKIIKSPFETMGPGVYSFVMDNINRLRPSPAPTEKSVKVMKDEDDDEDDDECKDPYGLGCQKPSKSNSASKWSKAVRDFIDDIADALDDFFGSILYE